jgi:hypothetical protein
MKENAQELRAALYGRIMQYMRKDHPDVIDRGYEFFWEEEDPADFLAGVALELAFLNFEDWFICDYVDKEAGRALDLFSGAPGEHLPTGQAGGAIEVLKDSVISLYEVTKAGTETAVVRDLLLGGPEQTIKPVPAGLKEGNVFGARLINLNGSPVMGGCIYPFGKDMRETVLADINRQFARLKKHCPDAGMRDFLKGESYVLNMIWISHLYKKK